MLAFRANIGFKHSEPFYPWFWLQNAQKVLAIQKYEFWYNF